MHADSVCANVIDTNELWPNTPAMQSALEEEVRRMHAPLAVQHWAAMLVPSGVAVAADEVMQTPLETASESPLRANVLKGGGSSGGGNAGGKDVK